MGTYSGFLLLEDMFDTLPNTNPTLYNEAQQLFNPMVKVVEEDCNTRLGKRVGTDFTHIGDWDVALDRRLTEDDLKFFLGQGKYNRFVRSPAFCTSVDGICSKCYQSYNPDSPVPAVGTNVRISSAIVVGTNYFIVQKGGYSVSLVADDVFNRAVVYVNDVHSSDFTIEYDEEQLPYIKLGSSILVDDRVFVRMLKNTSSPFMSYLSSTYAGDLLGAASLYTGDLPCRPGFLKERISEGKLTDMEYTLREYSSYIPDTYIQYIAKIRDPLERELYILALYGVFNDVEV